MSLGCVNQVGQGGLGCGIRDVVVKTQDRSKRADWKSRGNSVRHRTWFRCRGSVLVFVGKVGSVGCVPPATMMGRKTKRCLSWFWCWESSCCIGFSRVAYQRWDLCLALECRNGSDSWLPESDKKQCDSEVAVPNVGTNGPEKFLSRMGDYSCSHCSSSCFQVLYLEGTHQTLRETR